MTRRTVFWRGLEMVIAVVMLGTLAFGGTITRTDLFKIFFTWDSAGSVTLSPGKSVSAPRFISTTTAVGEASDGGGNFICANNLAQSSPCLNNPIGPNEIGGYYNDNPSTLNAAVYIGAEFNKLAGPVLSVLNNYGTPGGGTEFHVLDVMYNGDSQMGGNIIVNEVLGTDGRLESAKGALYLMALQTGVVDPIYVWSRGNGDVMTWFTGVGGTQVANLTSGGNLQSLASSGNYGFENLIAGAKLGVGPGANDYWQQDTNGNVSTPAYVVSATPFTLADIYVNNIPLLFTYGGGTLPARAFTVQAVRFYVRTAGSGGTTNATFQTSDGTNTCNCSYACNQATGSKRAACVNGAGTGCVYAASAALTYAFTAVGDCAATSADLGGNVSVEGIWQ